MNATIDKLNEKLDAKRADYKRTEEKIAKLQSRIDTEKGRLDKLTADVKAIEGEIIIQMVRSSDISLSELPDILAVYHHSEQTTSAEEPSAEPEALNPVSSVVTTTNESRTNDDTNHSIYSSPFSANTAVKHV